MYRGSWRGLTRRNIQAAREMDPKTPDKASCGVNWTEEPSLTSVSMRRADWGVVDVGGGDGGTVGPPPS